MKTIFTSLLVVCTFFINAQTKEAVAPSGEGTEASPYLIETLANLLWISQTPASWVEETYFLQTANIDAAATETWNGGEGWVPIGTNPNSFEGRYDGDNKTISNLYINRPDESYQGLFGYINQSVIIRIGLVDVNITAMEYVGAIAGYATNHSNINTSYSTGIINGEGSGIIQNIGGLVGIIAGNTTMFSCYSHATINTSSVSAQIGGIAGYIENSWVLSCYSNGFVKGGSAVGGLIGRSMDSNIESSFFNSIVEGSYSLGGLIGSKSNSHVINCYSSGEVNGSFAIGGLIGDGSNGSIHRSFSSADVVAEETLVGGFIGSSSANIYNSYSTGIVKADASVGGFVGNWVDGVIQNCYSVGLVYGNSNVGGFLGQDINPGIVITESFWNIPTSGQASSAADTQVQGKNIEEMVSIATYTTELDDGWDFADIWAIVEGETYPYLKWQLEHGNHNIPVFAGGEGTDETPFLVSNPDHLNNVRYYLTSHFLQTNDINLDLDPWNEGDGWEPIGSDMITDAFMGVYDGGNFTISGLFINGASNSYCALFGNVDGEDAIVKNLTMEDVNISGHGAGGLVGFLRAGSIINCKTSGTISSNWWAGGLVGFASSFATIQNSSSYADIFGEAFAGGLVGFMINANIFDSYVIGNITGNSNVGGIVGRIDDSSKIYNSYANASLSGNPVGGIAGAMNQSTEIINCYSVSTVYGEGNTGGLIGQITGGLVKNSYSASFVSGDGVIGGLIGFVNELNPITITNSFWDVVSARLDESAGGEAKDITEMISLSTYTTELDDEWDFDDVWNIVDGLTYPFLKWQNAAEEYNYPPFEGGLGTEDNPLLVRLPKHLNNVRFYLDRNFAQTGPINLNTAPWNTGEGWIPIGEWIPGKEDGNYFTGTYDGGFYTIEGLYINRNAQNDNYQGLFGRTKDAHIKNLKMLNVEITATNIAGSIAGEIDNTTIELCTSKGGNIHCASMLAGGLVGRAKNSEIIRSMSDNDISVDYSNAGGIAAYVGGTEVTDCFSKGSVSGNYGIGGLVGQAMENDRISKIENSYSVAEVSTTGSSPMYIGALIGFKQESCTVENSYWDIFTAGVDESDGGTPKTTAEMVLEDTFVDWGFDEVWNISTAMGTYPFLKHLNMAANNLAAKYSIALHSDPAGSGNLTGAGEYFAGADVTISATANTGFEFVNWINADTEAEVSDELEFTHQMINENGSFVAVFEEEEDDDDVSIDVTYLQGVNIYPNPTKDYIFIESFKNISSIRVVNIVGKIVRELKLDDNSAKLLLNDLDDGIYILNIIFDDSTVTQKIQIIK